MGKRGPKPKGVVRIRWSSKFAYAIGLLVTDGCLYSDGRHINFTSKDFELIKIFQRCLDIKYKVGRKSSGSHKVKKYYVVQIGDVQFYRFLLKLGITPRKTKTIGKIKIPDKYLFDFLRGHFDGDGTFYSYWDLRWKSSFMFYTTFVSASKKHIKWIRSLIENALDIKGHISKSKSSSVYQLRYAKRESLKLLRKIYYNNHVVCLSRKRLKVEGVLRATSQKLYARVV